MRARTIDSNLLSVTFTLMRLRDAKSSLWIFPNNTSQKHKEEEYYHFLMTEISVFEEFYYLLMISFFSYYSCKFSNLFAPFDSSPWNLFYYYSPLYKDKDVTFANFFTRALWFLLQFMDPVPKSSLLTQNLSLASSLVSFLINCWVCF